MSREENKVMIQCVFEDAVNHGNMAVIDEVIDEAFDLRPTEIKQWLTRFRNDFPDLHVT